MPIALPEVPIEQLARAQLPDVNVGRAQQDRLAALAHEIHRVHAGRLLTVPPYEELSEEARGACRVGVIRILQALVLDGWIELPS